jgi:hypothetical protein
MDDERTPHDVDRRVRAALAIDDAVSRRVVTQALKTLGTPPARRRRVMSSVAVTLGIGIIVGLGVWRPWRAVPASPPPAVLRISSEGVVLVVESQDGRRWIVGSPPVRRTGGNYVLVVPQ